MANNQQPEGLGDEFFEQILSVPSGYNSGGGGYVGSGSGGGDHGPGSSIFLGLGPGDGPGHGGVNVGGYRDCMGLGLPLGLNLDHGSSSSGGDVGNVASPSSRINENELHLTNLFPAFGQLQSHSIRAPPPSIHVHQVQFSYHSFS
ncbi:hypothetical protein KSS87_002825 [Heliosperma pusillum]|nr:hypothetical protein KSS87_002825 [Heliosperma pusillum]